MCWGCVYLVGLEGLADKRDERGGTRGTRPLLTVAGGVMAAKGVMMMTTTWILHLGERRYRTTSQNFGHRCSCALALQ